MKAIRYLAVTLAVIAVVSGLMLYSTSDSTADKDYMVYYVIADERLTAENYSIDCEGIYVTNSYVFFKSITGNDSTRVGKLPGTENVVSRYVSTDLRDDGYVVNPEGDDVSGWFTESTFENKVSSSSTLSSLDSDHDGIIYLYMKAARLYQVHYEARSFIGNDLQAPLWYDGHYMETTGVSGYTQNRFEDVEYIIELVEGQTIPNSLPDAEAMYSEGAPYSSLAQQAGGKKDQTAFLMDGFTVGGHENVHWFLRDNVPDYPDINTSNCTPVYPGLTVTSSLDPDDDGTIVLYGKSTRTDSESVFLVYVTFAQEDTAGRNYGEQGYSGMTENIVYTIPSRKNSNHYEQISPYNFDLPSYAGFNYYDNTVISLTQDPSHPSSCTVTINNGVVTITNCSAFHNIHYYHIGIIFTFHRQSVQITVNGETSETMTGYYGRDLELPSEFESHMLYEWNTSGLSNTVWSSGLHYYYTVSLADLNAVSPSITATWQEGIPETVYTIMYHSRVNGSGLVPGVVTNDGFLSLPMITCEGYSHLGWALVDPDALIDYDTSALVIYPGRTTFVPSAVSSQYKTVPDNNHPNLITIHLYAVWCTTYTISFDANGGTGSMEDLGPVQVSDYISLPANTFTRNNYEFVGWAMSPGGSAAYADRASVIGLSTQTQGLVTLFAVWSSNTNYVVFDGNNSTSGTMAAQSVARGDPVTLNPNQYVRTGYTFAGWATSAKGAVVYADGATFTPASTVSLYAVWSPISYTVRFDANGGTGSMADMVVNYGQSVGLTPNAFTNGNIPFGGWACSNGSTYSNGFMISNLATENGAVVTMYAIWSQYYVEYHANNGSGNYDIITVTSGVPYTIIETEFTPREEGEVFVYWCTTADGSGTKYYPGSVYTDLASPSGTIRLYAIWQSYVYYIQFDANGGTGSMNTITVAGGETVVLTNQFTYEGRYFLGWTKNPLGSVPTYTNGQSVVDIGTGVNGETVTLYALWSERMVTVTVSGLKYVQNGNVMTLGNITAEVAFGTDHQILAGDIIRLALGVEYSSYSQYLYQGDTYYLTAWNYTYNAVNYSGAYGSTLIIPEDANSITLTASYVKFVGYYRYNINNGTAAEPLVTTVGLTLSNGIFSASVNLSDCPFTYDGYEFCMWSRSANSLSDVMLPGSVYNYSGPNSDGTIDFYAVWIKVEPTGTNYYAGGTAVTPEYTVTAKYGTTEASVTPDTVSYQNNINAGTATMTVTLDSTYLGRSFSQLFTISPAQINITVDNKSKYYGESDPTLTGSYSCPTVQNPDIEVLYSRTAGQNAGQYVITASFTPDPNYVLNVLTTGTFTIVPAPVTIYVDDSEKAYGTSDPVFTGHAECSTASTDVLNITYYREGSDEAVGVYVDVLKASWTANANYDVTVIYGTFTISSRDVAYFIFMNGGGGSTTYTDSQYVVQGMPFADVFADPNSGYSLHEWVKVTYNNGRIVALTHVTYSVTLESEDIDAGETYMAIFAEGVYISFNGNGGTGSMTAQEFNDHSETISASTFEKEGYVFMGWSLTSNGPVVYADQTPLYNVSGLSTTNNLNVLYAVWAPYSYTATINLNIDEGEPEPQQMIIDNGGQNSPMNNNGITNKIPEVEREDLGLILKAGAFAAIMVTIAAVAVIRRRN